MPQVSSNRICSGFGGTQQYRQPASASLQCSKGTKLTRGFQSAGLDRLKLRKSGLPSSSSVSRNPMLISAKAKNLGQEEFEETITKAELPVLVDFWAAWCGPCKLVAPFIDWAADEYSGKLEVYKVDTESNPVLREKYRPYGLPTLILFKGGKIVPGSRREGAISKAKLKDYLDGLLQPQHEISS